jgi:hypothetical protein
MAGTTAGGLRSPASWQPGHGVMASLRHQPAAWQSLAGPVIFLSADCGTSRPTTSSQGSRLLRGTDVTDLGAGLDFGRGSGLAVFDSGLERGVVAFVLVGVGFGEVGNGLVEFCGAAEVGGQGDAVT